MKRKIVLTCFVAFCGVQVSNAQTYLNHFNNIPYIQYQETQDWCVYACCACFSGSRQCVIADWYVPFHDCCNPYYCELCDGPLEVDITSVLAHEFLQGWHMQYCETFEIGLDLYYRGMSFLLVVYISSGNHAIVVNGFFAENPFNWVVGDYQIFHVWDPLFGRGQLIMDDSYIASHDFYSLKQI